MAFPGYLESRYLKCLDTHPGRERAKTWLTTLLLPYERRRADAITASTDPLRLHLGRGDTYLPGWINIDVARPGRHLDLRWNLRRGLPFPNGSASGLFTEHFFEHLDLNSAFVLLVECRRVLAPGGICRIAVPNFERYIRAYVGGDDLVAQMRPGRPTTMTAINEVIYCHGHRSMYDAETMCALLSAAGFSEARCSQFGESRLAPCPDSQHRELESLYVEAVA